MPLKKYDKKLDYSYTYGVFPTIDLLNNKSQEVIKVVLNSKGVKNEGYSSIQNICAKKDIRIEYDTKSILKISEKENTYAIGVFKKYETAIDEDSSHVVLVNPSNTGNLGTIIRTMAGFSFFDLAIIRPAVDIFEPKVIRSSMGSFFTVNFEHFNTIEEYLSKFKNNVYTFMLEGAKELSTINFGKPCALVFGNESQGLSEKYKTIGQSVFIKHNNKIDSLNLSAATAITLYKASHEVL